MYNYIVKLNNIKFEAIHGVNKIEKTNKQLFEIDIAIYFCKDTCNDSLENSIDYEYVYSITSEILKKNTFNLIETLGEKIINKIFSDYESSIYGLEKVKATLRKPEVKFDENSNCAEVSVIRSK